MTPSEHETLQLKTRILVQKCLIDWLADLWRARVAVTAEPERSLTLTAMASKLQAGSKEYADLTMPWMDAANSDMQAGMFQEAYEEISRSIMEKVGAGLTPQEEEAFRSAAAAGFPSIKR